MLPADHTRHFKLTRVNQPGVFACGQVDAPEALGLGFIALYQVALHLLFLLTNHCEYNRLLVNAPPPPRRVHH